MNADNKLFKAVTASVLVFPLLFILVIVFLLLLALILPEGNNLLLIAWLSVFAVMVSFVTSLFFVILFAVPTYFVLTKLKIYSSTIYILIGIISLHCVNLVLGVDLTIYQRPLAILLVSLPAVVVAAVFHWVLYPKKMPIGSDNDGY